jgi:hypothetical protein
MTTETKWATKVHKLTETLKCELTREEVEEAAAKLAQAIDARNGLEDQRKAAQEQFKASIAGKEADITKFTGLVRNKYEFRQVQCEERFEYDTGEVLKVRLDTGEIWNRRKMLPGELQQALPLDDVPEVEETEQPVGDPEGIDPFEGADAPAYMRWCERNCEQCAKGKPGGSVATCDLQVATQENDLLPLNLIERLGYFNGCQDEDGTWECGEFAPNPYAGGKKAKKAKAAR